MAGVRASKVVLSWVLVLVLSWVLVLTLIILQTAEHSHGRLLVTPLPRRAGTQLMLLLHHGCLHLALSWLDVPRLAGAMPTRGQGQGALH